MTEDEKLAFVEAIADAHEDGYHRALAERTTKADPTFALEATEARGCCAHQQVGFTPVDHEGGLRSDAWRCKDCGAAFWPATALTAAEAHGEALRVSLDKASTDQSELLKRWESLAEHANALQARLTAVEQERDEYANRARVFEEQAIENFALVKAREARLATVEQEAQGVRLDRDRLRTVLAYMETAGPRAAMTHHELCILCEGTDGAGHARHTADCEIGNALAASPHATALSRAVGELVRAVRDYMDGRWQSRIGENTTQRLDRIRAALADPALGGWREKG